MERVVQERRRSAAGQVANYRLEKLERSVDALTETLEKLNQIMTEFRVSLAERYMTKDDVQILVSGSAKSEASQQTLVRWAVGALFALQAALFAAVVGLHR